MVLAIGLKLDYEAIEYMSAELIGRDRVGSAYAGPQAAAGTYATMARFADTGGIRLFGRPKRGRASALFILWDLRHRGH